VCGECAATPASYRRAYGSPPRVWGMLVGEPLLQLPERFTPTCVGNASRTPRGATSTAVHPHVCGECPCWYFSSTFRSGSPPRVWGMHHAVGEFQRRSRFTPTCVGNARCRRRFAITFAVHPHVCGECAAWSIRRSRASGSPPRVWGMRVERGARIRGQRFTPTCVGNAPAELGCLRVAAVHPHVCGECGA